MQDKNGVAMDKMIKRAVNLALAEATRKAQKAEEVIKVNYYLNTEKLLYKYPVLKKQVIAIEEYIQDLISDGYQQKSKDVVKIQPQLNQEKQDYTEMHDERIKDKKSSLERTNMDIKWIEHALNQIRNDQYYILIELKYFDKMEILDILKKLNISETTFRRKRNSIINELSIILYGSNAIIV